MISPGLLLLLILPVLRETGAFAPNFAVRGVASNCRPLQSRNACHSRPLCRRARRVLSPLLLGVDPNDMTPHVQSAVDALNNMDDSTTEAFSAILSTMFTATAKIIPNQSIPPLTDATLGPDNIIYDIPAMPGGAPRVGSPLIVETFRDLWDAPIKGAGGPGSPKEIEISAREMDFYARNADLLNRVPLAAAVYAVIDFFLINAEEDVYRDEIYGDEEGDEIVEVESLALSVRLGVLSLVVMATVLLSLLTYHPVPFNELNL